MYKASAIGDIAGPGCNERDGTRINARTINNADGLEGAEGKVDITTLDKINKILILVSY